MTHGTLISALLIATVPLLSAVGHAQERWWRLGPRMATADSFDGAFNFCRVMYRNQPFGAGGGWSADYPSADVNLSIRVAELTKIRVSHTAAGEPNHLVVRLTDDELFACPFILMAEVGSAYFDEEEAARLQAYLLKGGFLWVDDFWGSRAWEHWEREIAKVLPRAGFPITDIPPTHPLFRTHFVLSGIPQ